MDVARTRYARSGDAHIAYQVFGEGELDLVVVPGFVSNIEFYWQVPGIRRIMERLASYARIVIFDKRGTGLSDPVPDVPPLEQRMDDMRAVMEAASVERAALYGISEGGPASLLFTATYPDRVSALVVYGSTPRFSTAEDFPWGADRQESARMVEDASSNWGEGALLDVFAPSVAGDATMREVWGHFLRAGASPAMGIKVLEAMMQIDVRDILDSIHVPTLVIHRKGDRIAPVEGGRLIAERIEGSRLVELDEPDHLPFLGDVDRIGDEIEEFLTGKRRSGRRDRVLATILFTDIVESTRRASDLGDRRWAELRARHDEITRRQLERFRGDEVKTLGDGFLATFDGPARAVECACAIRDGLHPLGIDVRAGLHTGECELENGDISGMAVNIGARVGALAQPGEVLVSRTVKDLTVGADIAFEERGEHALKGVPGSWDLFAVAR
jgi:class 3 adenylate cyclase/alpha-beta hydrolase superfamily lysophospholipase